MQWHITRDSKIIGEQDCPNSNLRSPQICFDSQAALFHWVQSSHRFERRLNFQCFTFTSLAISKRASIILTEA
jgi:hypothetical protein